MAAFAADLFAGTAGTELSAYSSSWSKLTGTSGSAAISSAQRVRRDGTAITAYRHSAVPPSADYKVEADLEVFSGTYDGAGVIARASSSALTCYVARHYNNGYGWQLFKYVSGALYQLGSDTGPIVTSGSTHVELRVEGTTIQLYKAGETTPAISLTDSSITAAGFAGVYFRNGASSGDTIGIHVDNFSADTLGSGTTSVTSDSSLSYAIQAYVNSDLSQSAFILSSVSGDLSLSYLLEITNQVTSSQNIVYNIQSSVLKDLTESWEVRSQISSDLNISWNILGTTQSDLSTSYAILTTVQSDFSASYAVVVYAISDLTIQSEISGGLTSDLLLSSAIQGSTSSDLPLSSSLLSSVVSNLALSNLVMASVTSDSAVIYPIITTSTSDAVLVYTIGDVVNTDSKFIVGVFDLDAFIQEVFKQEVVLI